MATDPKKMITLLRNSTGSTLPEIPDGESVMKDETGYVFLRLAVTVHKDIITSAGYYASEEIAIDMAAAMAAVTEIIKDKAIMAAALIGKEDIAAQLSNDGTVDSENEQAVVFALMMLKECLRNYSMKYNALRAERLRSRGNDVN